MLNEAEFYYLKEVLGVKSLMIPQLEGEREQSSNPLKTIPFSDKGELSLKAYQTSDEWEGYAPVGLSEVNFNSQSHWVFVTEGVLSNDEECLLHKMAHALKLPLFLHLKVDDMKVGHLLLGEAQMSGKICWAVFSDKNWEQQGDVHFIWKKKRVDGLGVLTSEAMSDQSVILKLYPLNLMLEAEEPNKSRVQRRKKITWDILRSMKQN